MMSPLKYRLGHGGLTLVELLVSVALFGVSALAIASMMAEHSRMSVATRNQTLLSESVGEFQNLFDVYLSNTTRVMSCGCGNGCIYDEVQSPDCALNPGDCTFSAANPIVSFETEDTIDPSAPSRSTCYLGSNTVRAATTIVSASPAFTTAGMTLRGCKARLGLFLQAPTQIDTSAGTIGNPGTLTLRNLDTGATVARAQGVYSFRCGHEPTTPGGTIPSMQLFQYRVAIKARKYNYNTTAFGYVEGWHPSDEGFLFGPRRDLSGTISFRNLSSYGIHFGKTQTFDCTKDGNAPGAGMPCCSGYWRTGVCMSADAAAATHCISRGNTTTAGTAGALACCSLRSVTSAGGGRCL